MDLRVRPLEQPDLAEADRIFRLAFGTFLALPDPMAFGGDSDYVKTRWRAQPGASLGAYLGDELVGSNFIATWGSFGFFGPLTVRPDLWDKGVAQRLLERTMPLFDASDARLAALFTFPQSPKHVALYQKFGFWPQQLTPVMSKSVGGAEAARYSTFSGIANEARAYALDACRILADAVYPGLDLSGEIATVSEQGIGDTLLMHDGEGLAAFAVCHAGAGSEAGSGAAYVKFGAARPGVGAAQRFDRLLCACEAFAAARGLGQLVAGVNSARHDAYRLMIARGFKALLQGLAMQRDNQPGYNRPDCFVMDDWR